MSDLSVDRDAVRRGDGELESIARSLCRFVIRTALLPVTLLMTKPRVLAEASVSGDYKPLPSPFMLALVTGVVVSGVWGSLLTINVGETLASGGNVRDVLLRAAADFSTQTDSVGAVLFAIPYVGFLWLTAGLISLPLAGGLRNAETVFAALSMCFAVIVEFAAIGMALSLLQNDTLGASIAGGLIVLLGVFTLILVVKMVRYVFSLRGDGRWSWIGATVACILGVIVLLLAGTIGMLVTAQASTVTAQVRSLGDSYLDQERYDDAIREYDLDIRLNPQDFGAFLNRGRAFALKGEHARAVEDLTRVLEQDSDDPAALVLRGGAYLALKDYAHAIADYDALVRIAPTDGGSYNNRCWARALSGRELDRALMDCNEALRLYDSLEWTRTDSDLANARDSRGLVHLLRGQWQAAFEDYDVAVQLDDSQALSRYGRGIAQMRLGRIGAGQADLNAARAMDRAVAERFQEIGVTPPVVETP